MDGSGQGRDPYAAPGNGPTGFAAPYAPSAPYAPRVPSGPPASYGAGPYAPAGYAPAGYAPAAGDDAVEDVPSAPLPGQQVPYEHLSPARPAQPPAQYPQPFGQYPQPFGQYPQPSGQYPPPYGQYPPYGAYAYPPPTPSTPAIAITGLVLAFVVPLAGFVVSLVALPRTRRAGAGRGLARAGVAVGAVLSVLAGVLLAAAIDVYDEQAQGVRAAVTEINRSMDEGDCSAFFAVSTHAFRVDQDIADCEDFAQAQDGWADGGVQTLVTFVSVLPSGDRAVVVAEEEYVHADETSSADVTYELVHRGGRWLVDSGSWS